jgi:hypothetical protein
LEGVWAGSNGMSVIPSSSAIQPPPQGTNLQKHRPDR